MPIVLLLPLKLSALQRLSPLGWFFFNKHMLYQSAIILNQFEGLDLTLTALKISDIEQLNNEIFAWLSTRFSHL